MRGKSDTRIKSERLRKEHGLSYKEISEKTGVSKGTLSNWLKGIELNINQQDRLNQMLVANRSSFAARAWPINKERHRLARENAYREGVKINQSLPSNKSVDELALAMLYLGEGAKSYNRVQLASTDYGILRYFIRSLINLYDIDRDRLVLNLNIVITAKKYEEKYIDWWQDKLGYSDIRFGKTQFDKRSKREHITHNYHGVCTANYCDTYLQQRILGLAYTYIK
ncbi:helix-turn-helix transcriptional regulator [Candidatus Microgenomates bacterium]|nr:helix-turn-helix transcriptional regulator [Candidatus Microgenomates bacterium]